MVREIPQGTDAYRSSTMVLHLTQLLVRFSHTFHPSHPSYRPFSAIELVLAKARGIEAAVHKNTGGAGNDYKNKIRSLFVNLKDKANPGLRVSIMDGSITPERFAKMTSQVNKPLVYCKDCLFTGFERLGNGIRRA